MRFYPPPSDLFVTHGQEIPMQYAGKSTFRCSGDNRVVYKSSEPDLCAGYLREDSNRIDLSFVFAMPSLLVYVHQSKPKTLFSKQLAQYASIDGAAKISALT